MPTAKDKLRLKGWSRKAPDTHQRTIMLKKCGKKCFLGPNKSFPVCAKHTCKVSKQGAFAAYVRAKEYRTITGKRKYREIERKAKKIMCKKTRRRNKTTKRRRGKYGNRRGRTLKQKRG